MSRSSMRTAITSSPASCRGRAPDAARSPWPIPGSPPPGRPARTPRPRRPARSAPGSVWFAATSTGVAEPSATHRARVTSGLADQAVAAVADDAGTRDQSSSTVISPVSDQLWANGGGWTPARAQQAAIECCVMPVEAAPRPKLAPRYRGGGERAHRSGGRGGGAGRRGAAGPPPALRRLDASRRASSTPASRSRTPRCVRSRRRRASAAASAASCRRATTRSAAARSSFATG